MVMDEVSSMTDGSDVKKFKVPEENCILQSLMSMTVIPWGIT
jgi:hypothetical protein